MDNDYDYLNGDADDYDYDAWEAGFEVEGYEDYEPNPYDGTYSEE